MIYVHLAEGFEEVEALTVVDVFRRAQCDVQLVSIMKERLVKGSHGIEISADIVFENADYDACEMIVLPGGLPGASTLEAHSGLAECIKAFASEGKWIAAICAAPMALGTHGVIEGKKATIYPGMEDRLTGAEATGESVTVDGNIITGRGPALAMEFALTLLEAIKGRDVRNEVASGLLFE